MREINGVGVLELPADGPLIGSEQDALDLLGEAYGNERAELFLIPAGRLHPDFLVLRTGMAGAFLQKLQNYGFRFALIGNIATAVAASAALRDFVYESNKVGRMLFVADERELAEKLRKL